MRSASTTFLAPVTLGILAQLGVVACSSDSGGDLQSTAGSPSSAGASSAGASGAATGGAPGTGTAGSAGSGIGGTATAGAGQGGSSDGTSGSTGGGGTNGGSGGFTSDSGGHAGTGVAGAAGAGGAAGSAGASGSPSGGSGGGSSGPFALTSPAFVNVPGCSAANIAVCSKIPTDALLTTIMGANHSPELDWTAGPRGTLSYAIVLFDTSNMYPHWAIWNIPSSTMKLPTALPPGPNPGGLSGVKQAGFSGTKDQYSGPGAHQHVYQFRVYALKVATISPALPSTDPQKAVRTLLEGSADVLAKADLTAASP